MSARTEVLIVGAGPCGLAAAGELLRQGVSVRVLEADVEPRTGSRAILLWPPALELFASLGVMAVADRRGVRATAMNYCLPGGHRVRVPLAPENQPLLLPQAETERLLEAALHDLGGTVERGVRVAGVSSHGGAVTVKAVRVSGTELIEADWLIAADGVRSTVRERLGIEFVGEQFPDTIMVAEGQLDGTLSRYELHYYLGRAGGALLVPLPSGRFRLGTPVPEGTTVTPDLVQRLLDERGPGLVQLDDLTVMATFTSQERIAARMRSGHCFLVGDAAHTHSAIGGQGLNLGLQDVRNLTWKLAGVIAGRLRPDVLDTYEAERRHAAEETVRTTHRMARVVLAGSLAGRVRNGVLRLLHGTGVLQRAYPPLLAGWKLRYPDPRPGTRRRRRRGVPPPGARAPQWIPLPTPGERPILRLVTTGPASGELPRRASGLAARFPELARHEHLPRSAAVFLLLRPDGYVEASGTRPADLDLAESALAGLQPPAARVPHRFSSARPSTSIPQEEV